MSSSRYRIRNAAESSATAPVLPTLEQSTTDSANERQISSMFMSNGSFALSP